MQTEQTIQIYVEYTRTRFMKLIFTICSLFLVLMATAQFDPQKVNKKSAQLYSKALEIAQNGDFKQSIQILEGLVKNDPPFDDAWLSLAGMYGELKNYDAAIRNYEKARAIDSNYFKDYNLPYAINLAGKGEFEKALTAVHSFLGISNLNESSRKAGEYRKRSFEFAVEYARSQANSSYKFEPRNLGDSINTKDSEYFPTITIDNKELVFTRRVNNFNEDFYGSDAQGLQWGKARGLSSNINSAQNEGAQNIRRMGNGSFSRDAISRTDTEVAIFTFPICLLMDGRRRKIWATGLTPNSGSRRPAFLPTNKTFTLPAAAPADTAAAISG